MAEPIWWSRISMRRSEASRSAGVNSDPAWGDPRHHGARTGRAIAARQRDDGQARLRDRPGRSYTRARTWRTGTQRAGGKAHLPCNSRTPREPACRSSTSADRYNASRPIKPWGHGIRKYLQTKMDRMGWDSRPSSNRFFKPKSTGFSGGERKRSEVRRCGASTRKRRSSTRGGG